MKIEFLIPGSANDGFFSQIAFFKMCLNALGGMYSGARVVAVLGDHQTEEIPTRWIEWFRDIEIWWAHPAGAENPNYVAQADGRFEAMDDSADLSIFCDADVAIVRSIDELLTGLVMEPALAGIIAHYHFPWKGRTKDPDIDWPELTISVIGEEINRPYAYTLAQEHNYPCAPFYINYGFLAGPPTLFRTFYPRYQEIKNKTASIIGPLFAPQVSFPIACADLELPTKSLPLRYNYPNDHHADERYPEEMSSIAVFHYLRTHRYDRMRIFEKQEAFERFLAIGLEGSDRIFRKHVRVITGGQYPFIG